MCVQCPPLVCDVTDYSHSQLAVLYLYSKPPAHDESLASFSTYIMPFALLLHLLMGVWMYGHDEVLKSVRGGRFSLWCARYDLTRMKSGADRLFVHVHRCLPCQHMVSGARTRQYVMTCWCRHGVGAHLIAWAVQTWDAVGATEKITRLNTAPLFLFAGGVLSWVVFRESAGRILLVWRAAR